MNFTPDQILEVIKAVGPAALAVVGVGLGALLSLIGWGLRFMWTTYRRQAGNTSTALKALAEAMSKQNEFHSSQLRELSKIVDAVRFESHTAVTASRDAVAAVNRQAGATDTLQKTLTDVSTSLALASGKLDAVFRFMDLPKRASDVTERG